MIITYNSNGALTKAFFIDTLLSQDCIDLKCVRSYSIQMLYKRNEGHTLHCGLLNVYNML